MSVNCGCTAENGQLFACGEAESGKLGCEADAHVDYFTPQPVNISAQVISVGCGHNHTVVVTGS